MHKLNQTKNEYENAIDRAVEKILAMADGETASLECLLDDEYDFLTLCAIGQAIESEVLKNDIWLEFEEKDPFFKYKQNFQKRRWWFVDIDIVYHTKGKRYRNGDHVL